MSDIPTIVAAVFSAIATGFAAFATWKSPQTAACLAETLRRDAELLIRAEN